MEVPMPEKKPRRPRTTVVEPPKRRKVTMWLPIATAKKLRHAAVERGCDIGHIAGPPIDAELAGEYYAVRTSALQRLSAPEETAKPADGSFAETSTVNGESE
jgi:hypothetical protein